MGTKSVRRIIPLLGIGLALLLPCLGESIAASTPSKTPPVAELRTRDAVILGVIEGITEFLPISSTGHLIIANKVLHLDGETPLTDANGQPLWYKKPSPKHPKGEPLTLKLAADTYTVVIQFGAIAAVAGLYWRQIRSILLGLVGRDSAGLVLFRNLMIAFTPAAALGFILHDWIDKHLFSIGAVVTAQISGAVLMFAAEHWRKTHASTRPIGDLSSKNALGIGALQCAALWPGTSRSMTTIVGGYFAGLDPRKAAEFSFLLGLVTLTAATGYKSMKSGAAMIEVFGWPHVLLGCVVAAVTAAISIRFLIHYLTRHGLGLFAVYRLVTAAVLIFWFLV
jgi:undecaprenyl-diphosphatase